MVWLRAQISRVLLQPEMAAAWQPKLADLMAAACQPGSAEFTWLLVLARAQVGAAAAARGGTKKAGLAAPAGGCGTKNPACKGGGLACVRGATSVTTQGPEGIFSAAAGRYRAGACRSGRC